jgi:ubiquinone/menaquinone biosynthesis C-methylase UbiE
MDGKTVYGGSWNKIYRKYKEVEDQHIIIPKSFIKLLRQRKTKRVLDLGCGTGRHSFHLARQGFKVIAVDNSSEALKILKRKIKEQSLINIYVKKGSLDKIPLKKSSVDAIICTKALSHGKLSDIKKYISEIYRVLKPHGLILTDLLSINDPDFGKFKEIEPRTFLDLPQEEEIPHYFAEKKDIKELFSGFKIISIKERKVPASKFRYEKLYSVIYQIIAFKK